MITAMQNTEPNTKPETTPQSTRSTANTPLLIGVGAVVVLGIALYLGGLFQGRGQLATQKTQYEQRIKKTEGELQSTQTQLNIAQNRSLMMQARVALYRTAVDLDHRNFGTANGHLREAAEVLGKVDDRSGLLDREQIARLQSSVAATDINVATNLEEQRMRVLDLATQLNALMPEVPTETVE